MGLIDHKVKQGQQAFLKLSSLFTLKMSVNINYHFRMDSSVTKEQFLVMVVD